MKSSRLFCSSPAGIIRVWPVLLGLLWLGAVANWVWADTHYVRPPGTCTNTELQNPYTTWDTAATNIQWAVDAATNLDTVLVTNGAYSVTNQITVTNYGMIVRSVSGYSNTSVYATDWTPPSPYTTRCFYVTGNGVVDGFTISNGYALSGGGGGAYVITGRVQNCYFVDNVVTGSSGGGVYVTMGIVSNCVAFRNTSWGGGGGMAAGNGSLIQNCTIISNYAPIGGGGGIYGTGWWVDQTIASNCLIAFNTGREGGGVFMTYACKLVDCVISNNQITTVGTLYGGGVVVEDGKEGARITRCVIVNNYSASYAGGLYLRNWTISNSVIAGNIANRSVGGIYAQDFSINSSPNIIDSCSIYNNISTNNEGGIGGVFILNGALMRNSLVHHNTNMSGVGGGVYVAYNIWTNHPYGVINCTIVHNHSLTNDGGGIYVVGTNIYVANCVIAGNSSYSNRYPDVYFTNAANYASNFWYCSANVTSAPLPASQGNITNDPAFMSAGNWRLSGDSPCINAGTNLSSTFIDTLDLDGGARIRYGTVDMGAYEFIHSATIFSFH